MTRIHFRFQNRSRRTFAALTTLAALSVLAAGQARAQSPVDSLHATMARGVVSREAPATLKVQNREIAVFRADFLGYPPAERARAADKRIREIVREHARHDLSVDVRAEKTVQGWVFYVDKRWVFGLTPADADTLSGETLDGMAATARRNLEAAMTASLEQRSAKGLLRSIITTVLATAVYWFLLLGLIRLSRWAANRLGQVIEGRTARLNLPPSALLHQLDNLARVVVRVIAAVVGLGLTNVWLTFALKQFPYTYPWGDQIDDYLIAAGETVGLAILHAIPNLLMIVVIYLITRFVQKWVKLFYDSVRTGRIDAPGIDAETAVPAERLTTLFVWLLALAIAYPFIPGSDGVAFKGVSVLFGLMLSLGSSNVVSQAASGYMLMFSKALRVGDFVRVADYEGVVMSLGVLSTKIRTPRDEEINVPNTLIVGSTMKNYTRLNRENGVPVTTTVTIGYDAPWRQVHAMLLEAAGRTPGLRTEPAPRVLQAGLSDFYVEYTLFARLEKVEGRAVVMSTLHGNIQDVFNEYGVQIMSPHFEGPPPEKVWVPKEKWYDAPATPDAAGRTTPQRKENE